MRVLLTGFTPFGGEKINPSYEVIKGLKGKYNKVDVFIKEIPTVFNQSIEILKDAIEDVNPDVVICVGQAGGRYGLSFERVAININDARIEDNAKQQPIDEVIVPEGQNAYFTSLPVKRLIKTLQSRGIPSELSNSAGTFVCNHLMYGLLEYIDRNNLDIKGGFIHVPFMHKQTIGKRNMPSLSQETMKKGFEIIIEKLPECIEKQDLKLAYGKMD